MPLTAIEIIEVRTPDVISEVPSERLDKLIALAGEQTGLGFGTCRENAIALRVLHWITKSKINGGNNSNSTSGNGVAGKVSSMSEGGLSVSYSSSGAYNNEDLGSTQYGVELLELANSCFILPRNRFC